MSKKRTYRVGEIVRMWREEAGLKRYSLAQRAGIATQAIDAMEESEHIDRATLFAVRRVCAALGRSVQELCDLLPGVELGEPSRPVGRPKKEEAK